MYSAFPRRDENFVSSYLAVPVLVAGAAAFAEPSLLDKSETSGYFEKLVQSLLLARHAGFGQGSSYGTKNIANKFPLLVKEKLGLGTLICAQTVVLHWCPVRIPATGGAALVRQTRWTFCGS